MKIKIPVMLRSDGRWASYCHGQGEDVAPNWHAMHSATGHPFDAARFWVEADIPEPKEAFFKATAVTEG